ncbi:MAG TPA: DUF5682 family protein, partial [Chitinophagaceae bacterium]|nr:DUF5682 family protein [Chitinophagaceae bacterium]
MIHILGIRHHGPGSAKNVKAFLEKVQPDIVLVEGPPEADDMLQWAVHEDMKPPVAILCYQPDNPQQSSFYPFATFSPEWQAILYAKQHNIHVRFMDLPVAHRFAIRPTDEPLQQSKPSGGETGEADNPADAGINSLEWHHNAIKLNGATPLQPNQGIQRRAHKKNIASAELINEQTEVAASVRLDPMSLLAEAAGYNDGEKWWEHMFEHRHNNEDVFDAVNEAMQALRELVPEREEPIEQLREAYMRKTIRQAEKEMFQTI